MASSASKEVRNSMFPFWEIGLGTCRGGKIIEFSKILTLNIIRLEKDLNCG